jgi:hypothetical protein
VATNHGGPVFDEEAGGVGRFARGDGLRMRQGPSAGGLVSLRSRGLVYSGLQAVERPLNGRSETARGAERTGGIFSVGDARFFGSTGGIALAKPIVGMAAVPQAH